MAASNYTAVFDACVLYPAPLRSFLMYLALSGQFQARWTNEIHEEWIRNLLAKRQDLSLEQLEKVRKLMNQHVPGCLVNGYQPLINGIELPDPDDRHVVAAAIHTRAEVIVTFNLKDFPDNILSQYNLKAIHPDDFITDLFDLDSSSAIRAAQRHRASLKSPPFTTDEYLNCLLKQRLPETVKKLSYYKTLI